jgi:hypothetical protein
MSNQKLKNWAIGVSFVIIIIVIAAIVFLYHADKVAIEKANEVTPITDPVMRDFVNKMMEGTTTNK